MPEPSGPVDGGPRWFDDAAALAAAAVAELLDRPAVMPTTRLLAIDGPAGSGKTTLAGVIADLLEESGSGTALEESGKRRVQVLSLDDLYDGWGGLDAQLERRVRDQVLEPLRRGERARWQAYDWAAGAFADWRDLDPVEVLVLEGCGAGARLFGPYTSVLVWVEAAAALRAERAVVRDGAAVLEHWADWAALEERTFARNATRSHADLGLRT